MNEKKDTIIIIRVPTSLRIKLEKAAAKKKLKLSAYARQLLNA